MNSISADIYVLSVVTENKGKNSSRLSGLPGGSGLGIQMYGAKKIELLIRGLEVRCKKFAPAHSAVISHLYRDRTNFLGIVEKPKKNN